MGVFRATYQSPRNANPQSGQFTFESTHPLNSKANEYLFPEEPEGTNSDSSGEDGGD